MKRLVYLAGAIAGCPDPDSWRDTATKALPEHWEALNPRKFEVSQMTAREVVKLDYGLISRSDAVLCNCTEQSWGTAMELAFAKKVGVPVVAFFTERHPHQRSFWLLHHSDAMFGDLDTAIRYLKVLH